MLRNVDADTAVNGTVTIHLNDGTVYENCDYPTQLFSEYESVASFWVGNKLYNIPLEHIKAVIFNPPE